MSHTPAPPWVRAQVCRLTPGAATSRGPQARDEVLGRDSIRSARSTCPADFGERRSRAAAWAACVGSRRGSHLVSRRRVAEPIGNRRPRSVPHELAGAHDRVDLAPDVAAGLRPPREAARRSEHRHPGASPRGACVPLPAPGPKESSIVMAGRFPLLADESFVVAHIAAPRICFNRLDDDRDDDQQAVAAMASPCSDGSSTPRPPEHGHRAQEQRAARVIRSDAAEVLLRRAPVGCRDEPAVLAQLLGRLVGLNVNAV